MHKETIIHIFASTECISAIVGAIIGGGIVIWWDWHKRTVERIDASRSFLVSIKTELESLWNRYNDGIGDQVANIVDERIFDTVYFMAEEYFIIYNNNAPLVGQLSNEGLVKSIIATYVNAKGFVDTFKLNNNMLSRRDDLQLMDVSNNLASTKIQKTEESLKYIAKQLKIHHNQLTSDIPKLISALKAEIKALESRMYLLHKKMAQYALIISFVAIIISLIALFR